MAMASAFFLLAAMFIVTGCSDGNSGSSAGNEASNKTSAESPIIPRGTSNLFEVMNIFTFSQKRAVCTVSYTHLTLPTN